MSATIHGLFVEFGPAELLDVALIGPLAMGVASYYLGPGIGILLGKLASDVVFMATRSSLAECGKGELARSQKSTQFETRRPGT